MSLALSTYLRCCVFSLCVRLSVYKKTAWKSKAAKCASGILSFTGTALARGFNVYVISL